MNRECRNCLKAYVMKCSMRVTDLSSLADFPNLDTTNKWTMQFILAVGSPACCRTFKPHTASVTKCCKLDGLKQQKCISS